MRLIHLAATALLLVACAEAQRKSVEPSTPPIPDQGSLAFLTLSDTAPAPGTTVAVTAYVRSQHADSVLGSFTVQLAFDTTGLAFLDHSKLTEGIRAVNAKDGVVFAAGASSSGFTDGKLFTAHFRVDRTDAVRSLVLDVKQLNTTDFSSKLQKLIVSPKLHVSPPR